MKTLSSFRLIIMSLFFLSCNTVDPPENKSALNISVEDVLCTEAWIKLTTSNLHLPAEINLITTDADGTSSSQISILNTQDSLLYIDSLLPNKTYSFQAVYNSSASEKVTATTMDTTSHNISWQVETVGDYGSYALDAVVINENDIWIVGEFYERFGSDTAYNAAHWNGNKWELKRILVKPWYNPDLLVYDRISTIFSFSSIDIWFSADLGTIVHWDGIKYHSYVLTSAQAQGTISKIWGTSSGNLYFIGSHGSITHYDGTNFSKMTSNTDAYLTDIYGTPDGNEVWACGWGDEKRVLLRLNNNKWEKLYDETGNINFNPYGSFISSLWTSGKGEFLVAGSSRGIVKHSMLDSRIMNEEKFNLEYLPYRIRGSAKNNVIMVGDASSISHFNGKSWQNYNNLINVNDRLRSVDIKNKFVFTTGYRFEDILTKALIIKGTIQ